MKSIRIIPCLDICQGKVVKGVEFTKLRIMGDPIAMAEKYYLDGADELTFLDITATVESRSTIIDLVKEISTRIFIPLTVGGGIKSCDEIKTLLRNGADKVSIGSSAVLNPQLISQSASIFGSQCIVVSLDAKKMGEAWQVYIHGGRINTHLDLLSFAQTMEKQGAGELLINSIDQDGKKSGYDLDLLQALSSKVQIPIIASGGAGSLEHLAQGVLAGKADALLLASLLHEKTMSIQEIKTYLNEQGVMVRC